MLFKNRIWFGCGISGTDCSCLPRRILSRCTCCQRSCSVVDRALHSSVPHGLGRSLPPGSSAETFSRSLVWLRALLDRFLSLSDSFFLALDPGRYTPGVAGCWSQVCFGYGHGPPPPQWRFDVVTVYYERRPVNPTIELFQNALLSS